MSEFLAEAQILIQANTVAFKAELAAALATVPKAIEIPVVAVAPAGATAAAASVGALAQESKAAAVASESLAATSAVAAQSLNAEAAAGAVAGASMQRLTAAEVESAAAARLRAAAGSEVTKGLIAQSASALGLRGAIIGANPAFLAATAGAIAFGKSVQLIKNFDTELNVFQATAGATADQMDRVRAEAEALGHDITLPAVGAQDAAEAMTELSKAGLSVQDSIDGARGVLQLATAANIDNAQATELAASALNAFGLAGTEASHVADVLANAANDSQGSIVDIGIALRQASAVGRQAGLSLEQVTGVLTIFARNGLTGSDAGTAFRTMLIRLINPTDKAAKLIQSLGLNLRTATGAIDLSVFDQFTQATKNLTKAQRDRDLAIIFGQDAIRGAAIATREGNAAIDAQTEALGKQGSAAELAAARTKGLAGAFENAKNNAAALGLTLGDLASGPVQGFLVGFAKVADLLNRGLNLNTGNLDETTANFDELRKAAEKLLSDLSTGDAGEFTGQFTVGLEATAKRLGEVGAELTRQGFLSRVLDTFIQLSPDVKAAMQDNVITPTEQAQLEATALGRAFLAAVPHTADLFQDFGLSAQDAIEGARADLDRGGKTVAQILAESIHDGVRTFAPEVQQSGEEIATNLVKGITGALDTAKGAIQNAFRGITRGERLDIGRLTSEALDVQFRGGNDTQLRAVLAKQLKRQQDLVATLTARSAPQAKIDQAKRDAIATQDKIDSIDQAAETAAQASQRQAEENTRKRQQAAQKLASDREKADKAFLDALSGGRRPIERKITRAEATEGLADDLKRQAQLRDRLLGEIDAISKRNFENAKDKATAIADRRDQLNAVVTKIGTLQQQQAQQIAQIAQDKFNLRVSIAQATGNGQALIKLFDQRIHDLVVAIGKAKDESKKELELKEQLAQTRSDRESAISDLEEKRIRLAELRGNEGAELGFINARIARLKKSIAAAKKEHRSVLDLQIALAETQKQKDELLKNAEDDNKNQTTAFDLLKEAADTFNQNAGNLINPNQPFAGPTGFTADIAQFLIRRQKPATPTTAGPTAGPVPPVALQDQPLIQAIEKLTDAIIGSTGNSSTATGTASARQSRVWHSENMIARRFQEA